MNQTQGFATESWPISRPKPYPKNARKWSQKAIEKVAASIREFGWRQPLVCDAGDVIVIGHLRLAAAQFLGLEQVPVHVARDLSPAKVRALRLADNRLHEEAQWDEGLLREDMLDLKGLDLDLSLTGFSSSELDALTLTPSDKADECPDVPKWAVTKPGDLWLMGEHRLLCGDCRSADDIARLFEMRQANLVFTSPPYAEQRKYDETSGFHPIPPDDYVGWFRPVAENIQRIVAADGSYFLNIKPSCDGIDTDLYVLDLVLAHAREWGFHFATEFCWERNGVPKSVTQRFKNQFEPVYQFVVGRWKMRPDAVRHFSENVPTAGGPGSGETSWANKQGGAGAESVSGSFGAAKKNRNGTSKTMANMQGQNNYQPGEYVGPGMAYPGNRLPTFCATHKATGHVAAFPVGLADFFIKAYTDNGDTTFDPFAGSGSVLIASEQMGRVSMNCELSPAYCDVIVQRWQNFTGREAKIEGHGATFAHVRDGRLREWEDAIKEEVLNAQT